MIGIVYALRQELLGAAVVIKRVAHGRSDVRASVTAVHGVAVLPDSNG